MRSNWKLNQFICAVESRKNEKNENESRQYQMKQIKMQPNFSNSQSENWTRLNEWTK